MHQVRFRDVADVLRRQIDDGTYPPGGRLPSEASLAKTFGCSRDTVRDALAVLATEGELIKRRGTPSIVRTHAPRTAVRLPPDATVTARPMTLAEAEAYGCGPGVAIFEVCAGSNGYALYRGDQHILTTAPATTR
ncbi:GntR family transcriptional regulator [Dactylosporangium sp. NPDC051484]|uniref:GntR family transcriptional regulator n=1 Tax=Dactylosporangium sp. NPDC051484 TaxID=3154942 RepID=UPI00344E91C0